MERMLRIVKKLRLEENFNGYIHFKSTNITERKNTKLHVQHIPKRYWRYLTEKQF